LAIIKKEGKMKNMVLIFSAIGLFLISFFGCIKVKHEMTIQPIHVTVEIKLKIDKELEDFFGDIDKASTSSENEDKKSEGKEK
jgi:hypothetical protein